MHRQNNIVQADVWSCFVSWSSPLATLTQDVVKAWLVPGEGVFLGEGGGGNGRFGRLSVGVRQPAQQRVLRTYPLIGAKSSFNRRVWTPVGKCAAGHGRMPPTPPLRLLGLRRRWLFSQSCPGSRWFCGAAADPCVGPSRTKDIKSYENATGSSDQRIFGG
jgi:hypothetical protein